MPRSPSLALTLLASLSLAATACGAFSADDSGGDPEVPARDAPKAPPVGGPAAEGELTEAFGVFVSPGGSADAGGTREHPLASIQAGIELGKQLGKRVYVCSGTFRESLFVRDSISIIGGLDCSGGEWHTSARQTRVEATSSPSVRASAILSPTRIEGLEIAAPAATTPSASSIGLIADNASMLVIARTRIVAANGANGTDGVEGTQLVASTTATGGPLTNAVQCTSSTCGQARGGWSRPGGGVGGTNLCAGAPGHEAEAGGAGGSGGLWQPFQNVDYFWQYYRADATNAANDGDKSRTSAPGANGADGTNGGATGAFTRDGYAPANGSAGTNGASGKGGAGGNGNGPAATIGAGAVPANTIWRGYSGAGGGAGGCAGLAGTPGTGGGASIAALLIQSAVTFDDAELVSARGGNGGRGTFGSVATTGGHAGVVGFATLLAFGVGKDGGRGGAAGISGNGASGPSIGIAHIGAPPIVKPDTKITAGSAGAAIDARSRTDAFGTTKTIPVTPAGVSKSILAL